MNQETVITKRVTWYIYINGLGDSTQLAKTYKRLYEVAHAKNKGGTGGHRCGRSGIILSVRRGSNIGRGGHLMVRQ